jgi:hypothetical protein
LEAERKREKAIIGNHFLLMLLEGDAAAVVSTHVVVVGGDFISSYFGCLINV